MLIHAPVHIHVDNLHHPHRVLAHFPPADTYGSNADVKDVSN